MKYNLINTLPDFKVFWNESKNKNGTSKKACWKKYYYNKNKDIFDFYLSQGFGKAEKLNASIKSYSTDKKVIELINGKGVNYEVIINGVLKRTENVFPASAISFNVIIIVGFYGFGFWLTFYNGQPTIFIAIEKSFSDNCLDIMLAHEIGHIIHFISQPKNSKLHNVIHGKIKKNYKSLTIADYLMTDGIATYTSSLICPDRPEVLYSYPEENKQQWYNECKNRELELIKYSLASLNKSDLHSLQTFILMSGASKEYPKRIGYFIGYQILKQISKKHPISKIMKWPSKKYRAIIKMTLEDNIKKAYT